MLSFLASVVLFAGPASARAADDGHWILSAGVGVPKLSGGELRISGDLTVGYGTPHFAVALSGGAGFYDFSSSMTSADNTKAWGNIETWYLSGDEGIDVLRFEARITAGYAYYDTTFVKKAMDAQPSFDDHTSNLGRGTALVGGRLRAGPVSARLLVGGGAQFESYSDARVQTDVTLNDVEEWSFRAEARGLVRWRIFDGILSLRASSRAERFEITRDEQAIQLGASGSLGSEARSLTTTQLELRQRLCVDLDVVEFAGFVPAIFVGADYFAIESAVGSQSTWVPIVGVELAVLSDID